MEKYSAYRDAGTGIQPFLTPVPPNAPTVLASVLVPFGYILGTFRTIFILLVAILYFLLVEVVLKVFSPVTPLRRSLSRLLTAVLIRLTLFLLGFWWISITNITRKRGRGSSVRESWLPKSGDIIVSNWSSWIEILWLAYRFDPIFVLPVSVPVEKSSLRECTPASTTPGRRTGTGSAAISSTSRPLAIRTPIIGFQSVSLLDMLRMTGKVPPFSMSSNNPRSIDSIRKDAARPIVVFPECTTSNGRAMLRFADVFGKISLPVKGFKVFVMCVRYDPPTLYTPTLTCSIPSLSALHPLPHIFKIATSLSPSLSRSLSIRLLNPTDSPSSGSFLVSEVLTGGGYNEELTGACEVLVAQLGKMRVTGLAWEDKAAFLEFYRGKTSQ